MYRTACLCDGYDARGSYPWLSSCQVIANNRLTRFFASGCYRNTLTLTVRGVYLTIHHESRRRNAWCYKLIMRFWRCRISGVDASRSHATSKTRFVSTSAIISRIRLLGQASSIRPDTSLFVFDVYPWCFASAVNSFMHLYKLPYGSY